MVQCAALFVSIKVRSDYDRCEEILTGDPPSMIEYLELVLLGVVQGITEFLPISSDGHLAVASAAISAATGKPPESEGLIVTILLHLGTLLAVLAVFREPLWRLLTADRRVIGLLVAATIPAACVGLPAQKYFSDLLESPLLAGFMLPINGCLLLWISRKQPGELGYAQLTYRQALMIGLCQATALLPGISRSGTTIVAGLATGLRREEAATFSFLMAVPAVGGAVAVQLFKLFRDTTSSPPPGPMITGMVVSLLVGLVALHVLLNMLKVGRLQPFGWWCIGFGALVVAWQLAR